MLRLSNRNVSNPETVLQYVYVETPAEVQVVEKEVVREVQVPGETVIIHQEAEKVDLQPLHDKCNDLDVRLHNSFAAYKEMAVELEMQRRALVAIKAQRDIDRSRRLMLLRRVKKEHNAHKKTELKLKLAMGASLLLSIVALLVRH